MDEKRAAVLALIMAVISGGIGYTLGHGAGYDEGYKTGLWEGAYTPLPEEEDEQQTQPSEEVYENLALGTVVTVGDVEFAVTRYEITNGFEWTSHDLTAWQDAPEGKLYLWVYVEATNKVDEPRNLPLTYDIELLYYDERVSNDIFTHMLKETGQYDGHKSWTAETRSGWIAYEVPDVIHVDKCRVEVTLDDMTATWKL